MAETLGAHTVRGSKAAELCEAPFRSYIKDLYQELIPEYLYWILL
jgi:hypothetical protein